MAAAAVVAKKPLGAVPPPHPPPPPPRPRCRCCQPAVSACRRFWDELLDAVRRRRSGQRREQDTSEDTDEDLGLPRSPANTPPTTADVLLDKPLKENPTKSHSTCSDGSLLSMGSSEMDEDSMGQNSGHSSKLSLQDKKIYQENASDAELDIGVSSAVPLSHSAARHKMAVRPKRTHGVPRRHRMQQISAGSSLPTTPEVNEETSCRSISPEVKQRKECNPRRNKRNVLLHCWKW